MPNSELNQRWMILMGMVALAACDTAQDGDTTEDAGGTASMDVETTAAGTTGGPTPKDSPYDCNESSLTEVRPLVGAGFTPGEGLTGELQDSYVVHTTQLLVYPEQMQAFIDHGDAISAQLDQSEGLLAYALAFEPNCGFQRTIGIWRDTAAMYGFVASGAHVKAMAATLDLSSTGKVTHWQASAEEVNALDWGTAIARIAEAPVSGVYPPDHPRTSGN